MAPNYTANPYCSSIEVQADGSVTFACSQDKAANAWLTLPPHHPVVVQTQAFWTAVGASIALQGMEATQWSALTWIDWQLGSGNDGHAVRGTYRRDETSENPSYEVVLYNEAGATVVTIRGRGVIFRNRNFEAWRADAKAQARQDQAGQGESSTSFTYATPQALGLTKDERALVAPIAAGADHVEALVTAANGFPPGNPLIGGSGDHVNSTHFHEIARQATFLVKGRTDIETSGTMTLNRYVELGTPLRLNILDNAESHIAYEIEQLGKTCAQITLRW